jgi:hypothetical protein
VRLCVLVSLTAAAILWAEQKEVDSRLLPSFPFCPREINGFRTVNLGKGEVSGRKSAHTNKELQARSVRARLIKHEANDGPADARLEIRRLHCMLDTSIQYSMYHFF